MIDDADRHSYTFFDEFETHLSRSFLDNGYVIIEVEDRELLDSLTQRVAEKTAKHLGHPCPKNAVAFLNKVHEKIAVDQLNDLRLAIINDLRKDPAGFQYLFFSLAKKALFALIGNEIAMQRSVGLSVQLPRDNSSLLPIHADVWDGDSPFEVVMWLPLVDCFATKSMYLVPLQEDRQKQRNMAALAPSDAESLFQKVKEQASFLTVPYGKILLFSQTLMHGNRINQTEETRWSMNCRFKSVTSPYNDKKLIEAFEPITLRAATRIGMNYEIPTL